MKNHIPPHTLAPPLRQPVFTPLLRWLIVSLFAVITPVVHAGLVGPTIDTPTSGSITATTATLGGNLTGDNGSAVTVRGVVYSKTADDIDPYDTELNVFTETDTNDPSILEAFTVNIVGLTPATAYTFKAFATNANGTTYTVVGNFTTDSAPSISDPTSANITHLVADLGGNVTSDGGDAITARGVVYSSTDETPTIEESLVQDPAVVNVEHAVDDTGMFDVATGVLTKGTTYFYRAYAINPLGTTYTAVDTFTTDSEPTVTTPTSAVTSSTAATVGGNVTSDNGDGIDERGVIYSKSSDNSGLTLDDVDGLTVFKATAAGTTGVFTTGLTGLAVGTVYDFVAYATNAVGTTYTSVDVFETTHVTPTIASAATSASITTNTTTALSSATLGGNITFAGAEFIERGVVYSLSGTGTGTNNNPQIGGANVLQEISEDDSDTLGAFTVNVSGLVPGKQYYFYAYVINDAGTVYNSVRGNFTTPAVKPLISAVTEGTPTSTGVTLGANVTNTGGRTLTEVGIVYSISSANADPLLLGTGVSKATIPVAATGVFTKALTGLQPFTTYSYKAYATNAVGTSYTALGTFTTAAGVPILSLPTKTSISDVAATLGGTVTSASGSTITARGVVYSSTNADPTLIGAGVTSRAASGTTTGVFTVVVKASTAPVLSGLTPNTTYYYKAYATNALGTGYTAVGSFTTLAGKPSVTSPTAPSGSITATAALLGGNVTDDNGAVITERGVVYALTASNAAPQILGTAVTKAPASTASTGVFTVSVSGLTTGKQYSYRAYATNSKGTTYSSVATFTTDPSAPTIASPTKASVLANKATLGGNITKNNGATVTARGVVYSKTSLNSNPEIGGDDVTRVPAATVANGIFTVTITGLTPGTAYSFKAYAINSEGTTYTRASELVQASTFTTPASRPTVTSPSSSAVGPTTASISADVTTDNGADITERGIVYSFTNVKPSLDTSKKKTASGTTGELNVSLTGLMPAKKYYYRAYAKNSKGTGYSAVGTFTTDPDAPSIRSTPTKTNITISSAKIGGSGIKANGSAITERGVVYSSTDSNPRIGDTGVIQKTSASTMSSFGIIIKGLAAGTEYSFRAYAINAIGTTYTDVGTFTTLGSSAMVLAGSPAGTILGGASASAADTTETYYTIDPATGLKYLTIVINKAAGTESQPRTVEVSGNLTEWFSGSSHTTVLSDDAGVLKVRDNTPVTADAKRYIRLK